jgi:hypothetical protein
VLKVFVSLASIALITLFLCLTGGYHIGGVMENMLASGKKIAFVASPLSMQH